MESLSESSHQEVTTLNSSNVPSHSSSVDADVEKKGEYTHLQNSVVRSFAWEKVSVQVIDRTTKNPRPILDNSSGVIRNGEMMAIMGPSGCGKTTLLNVLANRCVREATIMETLLVNGQVTLPSKLRRISCFVEQEEALLGALTVRETIYFASKLSLPSCISKDERIHRIEALLAAFGLSKQADVIVGTPIRTGISGGQKRRLTVASQLITSPKVIFLDEPTSGLDSQAAYEVMSFVKNMVVKYNLLVVASIHQPSTSTFGLFDRLLLLSQGSTVYNGSIHNVGGYFGRQGYEMPQYINPAEFVLEIVSTDFATNQELAESKLQALIDAWERCSESKCVEHEIMHIKNYGLQGFTVGSEQRSSCQMILLPFTLVHRSFIKSYRDVIAYGIRVLMYVGLAILMGTVWLRLSTNQDNIASFTNAIFYGGAFMSFMAVAYIPSFLEDRSLYIKERANGLYGPTAFMISNFIIGLPFLFLITLLFSVLVYWLSNFRPTAGGFWMWVLWLFLDLLAAESLVVLVTNLVPIFVVSLAVVAFANGLWMSVNGFMVSPHILNVFWRYVFHYIDYQAYVFKGMMVNEFAKRTYECQQLTDGDCHCIYITELQDQCQIDGRGVLKSYGFDEDKTGLWLGILLCTILVYRLLAWVVLYFKRS